MSREFRFHHLFLLLMLFALLASCVQQAGGRRDTIDGAVATDDSAGSSGPVPGQAANADSSTDTTTSTELRGEPLLRHMVDPFVGTYKTKLTIPKNYAGYFYLSGLNIASLSDRIVSVRFNFGRDLEPVVVPATIGRGKGITPQTDIRVLILDLRNKPFQDIRLLYDLYDYGDYDSNNDGSEELVPTSDPRSSSLYCRGLKLEHDHTFVGSNNNPSCDSAGERCLYSYAKIQDSGLYEATSSLAMIPSEPQIDLAGDGYTVDSNSNQLLKCLPDSNSATTLSATLNTTTITSASGLVDYQETVTLGGNTYNYYGPFRTINESGWEVSSGALFSDISNTVVATSGASGLFQLALSNAPANTSTSPVASARAGYKSFLFPRVGKMELRSGIDHFSSTSHSGTRTKQNLLAGGETGYMDGCNIRTTNYDTYTGEGISSCNVSATIDIITTNSSGKIEVLTTSNEVKLQLIRPSDEDYLGRETLYTSMKSCSTSNSCASSECCYNDRCWSKELVTQCLEDANVSGYLSTGESCSSDYECASLCCNPSSGSCAIHVDNQNDRVLCSKSPGQSCVSSEWCREENIPLCLIVKTGMDASGQVTCSLRCYNKPTFGICRSGTCVPPTPNDVPSFDPANPDCTSAQDPPSF
ncbi:MAG: hypothetical protein HN353_05410 [Bdellovibrionales bacterium]|nr:hypothetical protein [Bdellovibrionales bacterium]MBT3525120.1 hypothetical protein [Bdellovibrionales bacterium]